MYFIVVKFKVKPEQVDGFVELVTPFTEATRAEPGNLWFEWSRSIEDPDTFVLVEAFADDDAAGAHVNSEHFKVATQQTIPPALVSTPLIVSRKVEGSEWGEMGEITVA
ncbi:antibiotic biosynthesis monooxygenase [Nakamurella sp. YIM 132087]|uniref:Antibiotic biosynthesis monooxygenase n=1 Tax=Nakamurella alba TaxID=2665158 RepID=A0A7K1FND8_9ACTN|nr:putative quinol monooxygenase [Nakamurella alba]MTD15656.1 antibiotic biosynthesis monooxygenase [Nakamurella alba]